MKKLSPEFQAVYKEYPWLYYHPNTVTTYLPPDYYDKLLKKYTFDGRSDLDYFTDYLHKRFQPQNSMNSRINYI